MPSVQIFENFARPIINYMKKLKVRDLHIKTFAEKLHRVGWLVEVDGKFYGDWITLKDKLTLKVRKELVGIFNDQIADEVFPCAQFERNRMKFLKLFR
jgi:hypothetical protein